MFFLHILILYHLLEEVIFTLYYLYTTTTHYIRAIDIRGRELSRKAFEFSNTVEGFEAAKAWMLELAVQNRKSQSVLGLEPTGHYWFALAAWLITAGISVIQVNRK